ncbi:KilA-N domain-containing protein [Burkholderia glumae]|uniref:KilA-N domain-containing protein n=1 Tax=Burkholderia glumae TaxID=337 RepID=UPI002036B9EF|nr:KilA-N domain-containing protein [Burkholderia glumae]MCM2546219.1 KilA-N domain-containing protein [Burkholderia glumae]
MAKHAIIVAHYQDIDVPFTDDGWFNASSVAARFHKNPHEWLRLPATTAYLDAIERRYGKIPYVKTSKARVDRGGGTWLHPKLAVPFARWLDDDFAVWCDEQVDSLLRGNHPHFSRQQLRHEAAASYKLMSQVLLESRKAEGKGTAPHHFMTEAKVVNWAMSGEFAGRNREGMSIDELNLLANLEIKNSLLLARGVPYDERKSELESSAQQWRTQHTRIGA